MFEIFEEDSFADAVHDVFGVLDERYVHDQCKELLPLLQVTFDRLFETSFLILDRESGKPMNCNAVLTNRDAAEACLNIVGSDKFEIGVLLRDN